MDKHEVKINSKSPAFKHDLHGGFELNCIHTL